MQLRIFLNRDQVLNIKSTYVLAQTIIGIIGFLSYVHYF